MEQDRRIWFEMSGAAGLSGLPEGRPSGAVTGREPTLQKLVDSDDVEHYLTTFERIAGAYKWPTATWSLKLAPMLTGKAQAAYASLDAETASDFAKVREAILRRYNINEETFRQRFRTTKKKQDEGYIELEVRLRDSFNRWTHAESATKEQICDLVILEQLLSSMTPELQVWVRERKPKTAAQAGELADDYVLARKAAAREDDRKRCHNCRQVGHLARDCPE